jgi:Na+/H+ antiporter NhaD/arsenite permease-like protein
MLLAAIVVVFILGYIAIALEHTIRINKAASALILGTTLWFLWFTASPATASNELLGSLGDVSQILLFLMGAMTIVAIIDANDGFSVITSHIKTKNVRALVWIILGITFILSPVIDNLTTAIVMVTLTRRLIFERKIRLYFAGMIVIAANTGGAWSPIGDVTTTMLWMGGQISAGGIIKSLILPSLVSLLIPAIIMTFMLKGEVTKPDKATITEDETPIKPPVFERNLIFVFGVLSLLSVPFLKTFFHVPPYIAVLFVLGVFWAVVEFLGSRYPRHIVPRRLVIHQIVKEVDVPNVLFFAGILLAIGVLSVSGQLHDFAFILKEVFGDIRLVMFAIGIISAFVDNVPLVAAAMNMYSLSEFPMDNLIWEFIAFNCGTGGSMLVIGSAAGIAAMGIDKNLTFGWYLRKITPIAILSYCAGAGSYLLMRGAL